jgi:hypothetical protein
MMSEEKPARSRGAVDGGDFFVVELAAEKLEFAVDALADHGGFVGVGGGFFYGGFDVLVGDAAGAEFASYAVFALVADFSALAGKLFGVAGVVDQAVLLQAGDYFLDEVFVRGAADEGLFHFGDGMGAAHEDLDGGVVEDGLGVDGAGLEHAGQSKSGSVQESKSL